jgi:hypothetical protein
MAEFTVMKGFLSDFAVNKGGEAAETLPPDPGHDVTDEELLDDKTEGKEGERGGTETESDDITMAKDASAVDEGAKRDAKDGYTEDVQEEEISDEATKGFEAYNKMVAKGIAVEEAPLSKWDIGGMVDEIGRQASELTCKELSDSLVVGKGKRMDWAKEAVGGVLNKIKENPRVASRLKARKEKEILNRKFRKPSAGPTTSEKAKKFAGEKYTGAKKFAGEKYGAGKAAASEFAANNPRAVTGAKIGGGVLGGGALLAGAYKLGEDKKKQQLKKQ